MTMTSPKLPSRSIQETPSKQGSPWGRFIPGNSTVKQGVRPFWAGVRFKATCLAITVGVLPIVVISAAGYFMADRTIREQVELRQKLDAEFLATDVSRFMFERYDDIRSLAQQAILVNADLRARTTAAEEERFLNAYLETYEEIYDSVAFLNTDGDEIATTGETIHENHRDDDYFQAALRGTPYISQPRFSDAVGEYVIYLSAPVKDSVTEQIIGVVRTRMPVSRIEEFIADFEKIGELHFADANGSIFLSTEAYGEAAAESGNLSLHINQNADDSYPGLADLRKTATSGILNSVDQLDGEQEMLGYARTPRLGQLPTLGWFVLVEADLEEAFQPQQKLKRTFTWGALLSIAFIGAVSVVIVNRGVKPILAAAAAVERFGQGDFRSRLTVRGTSEVSTLGLNVNYMADQLEGLLRALRLKAEQLVRQNDALSELAQTDALVQGNAKATARACTEAIAKTLDLERVSIWLYNSDRSKLICVDQYELSLEYHSEGEVLYAIDLPEYFLALESEPLIATDNVAVSPIHELLSVDLVSPDTQAILNAPIQLAGRIAGLIRCDRVGETESWQAEEQSFVISVANLVSIAVESELLQQEVSHLLDVVSDVEEGNLTTQAEVSDRTTGLVADIFNRLIERLGDVLNQVVQAALQVSEGANQQKRMANVVAANADQQAQAVTQVLHLTEQAELTAQGSAEKVNATGSSLRTVRSALEQGQAAMSTLTEGIDVLQEGTNHIVQQMKTLGEFVGLADQFVQDQSQIASLTQTLALNASLVAARASEQRDPRQFVVVAREFDSIADQVSNLAQQTNESLVTLEQRSAQIHNVVSVIDADIQSLGGLVRGFTQGVEQSDIVFNNVQRVTGEALRSGEAVAQSNQEIVNAAQSTAQVVRDIAAIATKTAELTHRSRMKSEQIDALSKQLLQSIQFFQLPAVTVDDDDLQYSGGSTEEPVEINLL
ncbi:MAG: cache domain-containing protein [Leptolyngbyaceae cyanobacterium MO_188.B28]|nr:cache domain-containing protein [Leptolyngbyaceae cyanobacterium MO_188.B28]